MVKLEVQNVPFWQATSLLWKIRSFKYDVMYSNTMLHAFLLIYKLKGISCATVYMSDASAMRGF